MRSRNGFTLPELLIAMALLGVVATFTVPKVLQAQSTKQHVSNAKAVASGVVGAYSSYQLDHGTGPGVRMTDLTPYLNYVSFTTVGQIDGLEGSGSFDCAGGGNGRCYKMHNGGVMFFWTSDTFGGSTDNYCLRFYFDPDGKYGGSTTGASKSVMFGLYTDGDIRTYGTMKAGTWCGIWPIAADPSKDPTWFTWDSA